MANLDSIINMPPIFGGDRQLLTPLTASPHAPHRPHSTAQSPTGDPSVRQELALVSGVLELVTQILAASDQTTACQRLAHELQRFLDARRVVIGLNSSTAGRIRLVAVSGVADVRSSGEETYRLEERLNRAASALSNDALREERLDNLFALKDPQGRTIGAVLLEPDDSGTSGSRWQSFHAIGPKQLGIALAAVPRAGTLNDWKRRANKFGLSAGIWVKAIAALMVVVACIPIADPTYCDCTIEPLTRRHVAAPFAGILDQSFVRPGDQVTAGQLLAQLDGRELRTELAQVTAEQKRAAKSRDINLAANKLGAAQVDKLEMDRLEERHRLLSQRLEQLEIRSPFNGLIVSGDLQRVQGAPLAIGQTLFEVALLDQVCVELAIDDQSIDWVSVGQPVVLTIDGKPWQSWSGRLERLQPRAELRDAENVFIGEVTLENTEGLLRPGLTGRAKITGTQRPLGWILLRNLVLRLGQWIV